MLRHTLCAAEASSVVSVAAAARGAEVVLVDRSYCTINSNKGKGSGGGGTIAAVAHAATARWVDGWVVNLGLCPFAKKPRDTAGALRIAVTTAATEEGLLDAADDEIAGLIPGIRGRDGGSGGGGGPETTLLVLADEGFLQDFESFHRMYGLKMQTRV